MAYKPSEWTFGVMLRPAETKERLARELKKHDGNLRQTAAALKISRETLYRYIDQLGLRGALASVRKSAPRPEPRPQGEQSKGRKG